MVGIPNGRQVIASEEPQPYTNPHPLHPHSLRSVCITVYLSAPYTFYGENEPPPNCENIFDELLYSSWEAFTETHRYAFHMQHEPLMATFDMVNNWFVPVEAKFAALDYDSHPQNKFFVDPMWSLTCLFWAQSKKEGDPSQFSQALPNSARKASATLPPARTAGGAKPKPQGRTPTGDTAFKGQFGRLAASYDKEKIRTGKAKSWWTDNGAKFLVLFESYRIQVEASTLVPVTSASPFLRLCAGAEKHLRPLPANLTALKQNVLAAKSSKGAPKDAADDDDDDTDSGSESGKSDLSEADKNFVTKDELEETVRSLRDKINRLKATVRENAQAQNTQHSEVLDNVRAVKDAAAQNAAAQNANRTVANVSTGPADNTLRDQVAGLEGRSRDLLLVLAMIATSLQVGHSAAASSSATVPARNVAAEMLHKTIINVVDNQFQWTNEQRLELYKALSGVPAFDTARGELESKMRK